MIFILYSGIIGARLILYAQSLWTVSISKIDRLLDACYYVDISQFYSLDVVHHAQTLSILIYVSNPWRLEEN